MIHFETATRNPIKPTEKEKRQGGELVTVANALSSLLSVSKENRAGIVRHFCGDDIREIESAIDAGEDLFKGRAKRSESFYSSLNRQIVYNYAAQPIERRTRAEADRITHITEAPSPYLYKILKEFNEV